MRPALPSRATRDARLRGARRRAQCCAATRSAVVLRWYQPSLRSVLVPCLFLGSCPLPSALCSIPSASALAPAGPCIVQSASAARGSAATARCRQGTRQSPPPLHTKARSARRAPPPPDSAPAAAESPAAARASACARAIASAGSLEIANGASSSTRNGVDVHFDPRPAAFVSLQHQIPRNAIQIRRERRDRRIESTGVLRQRDEDILGDILGGLAGAEHLPAEPVDGRMVAPENDSQRLAIAAGHAVEQLRVCRFGRHAHGVIGARPPEVPNVGCRAQFDGYRAEIVWPGSDQRRSPICCLHIAKYSPFCATSSSWRPVSTMRPRSST